MIMTRLCGNISQTTPDSGIGNCDYDCGYDCGYDG